MTSTNQPPSDAEEMVNPQDSLDDDASKPTPKKTPMYEAIHASRYQRQSMIKTIEQQHDCHLICYVTGKYAGIQRDDTVGFMEMLHNIQPGENIDLLLHSGGGDVDAAEKLVALVQATVGDGQLRVIIPDFAKSAGTLMVLGADSLIMSDSSELGTIDPQISTQDGRGNEIYHSVLSYLDAFQTHSKALRTDPDDPVARLMLDKLDPITLRHFQAIRDRARSFAEDQLRRKGRNFSKIASELLDITRWPSHGQMIKWQDVKEMGLPVEYLEPRSDQWQTYWRLYCLLRLAVKDEQRIFESKYASLTLDP